jgi:hypothetical protein
VPAARKQKSLGLSRDRAFLVPARNRFVTRALY